MRQQWPTEVVERIDDLCVAGIPPSEIMRRLASGDAGLATKYEIPKSTFFAIKRKLVQRRGRHEDRVVEGAELSTVEALQRRAISLIAREVSRLEALAKKQELTPTQALTLTRLAASLPSLKRQLNATNNPQITPAHGARSSSTLLAHLRETEGKEGEASGVNGSTEASTSHFSHAGQRQSQAQRDQPAPVIEPPPSPA